MVTDHQTGRSKGFGIIKFENKESAVEAIKVMDKAMFNDRCVDVRLDNRE